MGGNEDDVGEAGSDTELDVSGRVPWWKRWSRRRALLVAVVVTVIAGASVGAVVARSGGEGDETDLSMIDVDLTPPETPPSTPKDPRASTIGRGGPRRTFPTTTTTVPPSPTTEVAVVEDPGTTAGPTSEAPTSTVATTTTTTTTPPAGLILVGERPVADAVTVLPPLLEGRWGAPGGEWKPAWTLLDWLTRLSQPDVSSATAVVVELCRSWSTTDDVAGVVRYVNDHLLQGKRVVWVTCGSGTPAMATANAAIYAAADPNRGIFVADWAPEADRSGNTFAGGALTPGGAQRLATLIAAAVGPSPV